MKYYFSDTENIGNKWSQFVQELSDGDHMIMFHTQTNSGQTITLDQLSHLTDFGKIRLYGIQCGRGNNALDFQLSSYLGFLLAKSNKDCDSFVILSKDKGYDPLVSFWKAQGYDIARKEPECAGDKEAKPASKPATKPRRKNESKSTASPKYKRQAPGTKTPIDLVRIEYIHRLKEVGITEGVELDKTTNVMMHTINLPSQGRALQIQNQMKQNFGQKRGLELYRIIKPILDIIIKSGPYPPKKEST